MLFGSFASVGLLLFCVNSVSSLNYFVSLQKVTFVNIFINHLKINIMARLFGLNGIIRGRQGNNVYSVQNGTQVLKVYQPAVSNPKTIGQREQRSKFALAGKISSATPSTALVGMIGGSPRSRRGEFVSNIVRNATTSLGATGVVATIDFAKIMFSQGAVPVYSSVPTVTAVWAGTAGRENIRVTMSSMALPQITPAGYGERYVIALFDGISYNLEEIRTGIRSSSTQVDLLFRIGDRRDLRVVAYTIPYMSNDAALAFRSSNLYDSESAVNLLGSQPAGATTLDFGNSVMLAVVPVLGTQAQLAPAPADDDMRAVVEEGLMETAVVETKRKK